MRMRISKLVEVDICATDNKVKDGRVYINSLKRIER